jgi:hypothetical protein
VPLEVFGFLQGTKWPSTPAGGSPPDRVRGKRRNPDDGMAEKRDDFDVS